jgi:hypothetical protein
MSLRLPASIGSIALASLSASPAFAQPGPEPLPPPRPELHVATSPPEYSPPCDPECEPPPLRERDADGYGVIGLRVSMTDARQQTVGLSFAGRFATYVDSGAGTARVAMFWNLGGGGAGFEGAFGGGLAGGVRARIDPVQSIVFRIGFEGYVLGDNLFYASAFELPQGQVGYQFFDGRRLFEIGAKSGAVLTGRFRDPKDQAERAYPVSVEWGGYGSLSLRPLRIDASYTRIEDRSDALGTPIDLVEGNSCGFVGPVALCADARWQRSALAFTAVGPGQLSSFYGGLTAGFGYRGDPDEPKHHRGPSQPPPPPPPPRLLPPPPQPPPLQVPAPDGPNAPATL